MSQYGLQTRAGVLMGFTESAPQSPARVSKSSLIPCRARTGAHAHTHTHTAHRYTGNKTHTEGSTS